MKRTHAEKPETRDERVNLHVRVKPETRNRLKAAASLRGIFLEQYLDDLASSIEIAGQDQART